MNGLREGGLRGKRALSEDVHPLESAANLADAMLVFACGLLLALATYWGFDLPGVMDAAKAREVEGLEESASTGNSDEGEEGFDELGTVYRDPETGKMYLIEEGDSDGKQ